MLISTMNDVPGYKVTSVLGEVFGLTVRSRNVGSQFGAAFKSLAGGELKGMTKNLQLSREDVVNRMVAEAEARGQRGTGHAVRHLRDGWELDGDLCLWHGGRHRAPRVTPAADARTDLVRACLLEPVARTPVWFMRQAGRSLPEYRAARGEGSILSAIADAALAAELTLQPVRRYGVDAAILFSDIVVPLHAVGFGVDVEPGRARWSPSRSAAKPTSAASERSTPVPMPRTWATRCASWRRSLPGRGSRSIGFAGAPFTVASYVVEGGPSRTFAKVKALMHGAPDLWAQLTERLAAMAVASLRDQVTAGAQAVQLFDSWAGSLSPDEYARFALPATRSVLEGIADLGVPTILFGVGTGSSSGSWHRRGPTSWASTGASRWTRRVGASAWVVPSRGTWTRPCASHRGPSSRSDAHGALPRRGRDGHRSHLQPRPRRPARI